MLDARSAALVRSGVLALVAARGTDHPEARSWSRCNLFGVDACQDSARQRSHG